MADGFHPNDARIDDGVLEAFLNGAVTGELREVPGIDRAAVKTLRKNDVTTTFQLFGKFLKFKKEGRSCKKHCDKFWDWLGEIGINAHRSTIVRSVAEKMDTMFPGIYVANEFD
mmetsp:Transcript_25875/g.38328  ORF Transcript_25875/g.38328 Transcript_25875/m.38328 type:complete len:114 (+) Transcript_25875:76-417(+)|eukprot:CAMPEP_0185020394 /NCGR_PEP_ID=MMETSP1103-20130426/2998_1 /TAXON_ID=36769 /ORGANISM="Paraphysomonas bandaiensis, Strain Caron Lab Isolate" /LENGTH=113 /DNA_ID=CAMNT_0027551265 /DNA_START=14 /DNA_END=355 /DNA_ORIENTATION=+